MRAHAVLQRLKSRTQSDEPLRLTVFERDADHVLEGVLTEPDGYWYPIIDGVPILLRGEMRPDDATFRARYDLPVVDQPAIRPRAEHATSDTFSYKWRRFRNYGLESSHQEFLTSWYCKKLGLTDIAALRDFYGHKRTILEVGPGSGFNSRFMAENSPGDVFAADISEAALTTFENTRDLSNCHVLRADLLDLPFADRCFDFVIADGVLHHTPDTRASVCALYAKVAPGGQFFFYVYKQMGAARQFADRYIREQFAALDPEECFTACEGLTELGHQLSDLNATVTLERGVPVLGIPPGTHNVQRLIYYNFVKCFWNDAFDFETNNMVNYDWYHPSFAWQHTEEEVRSWLDQLGVIDYSINDANPNGISVLLRRPAD
jgi:SAM-dependent methyltransferase/uncharacterized protein YbaR (Trm112 family)